MSTADLSVIFSGLALLLALVLTGMALFRKNAAPAAGFDAIPLRLQAYERLVLLTERIALPQLVARLNQPGISAVEMKLILNEHIKQEFDYNSTQQLYISQACWDAVRNLKEQNIMLVNQVAASLPAEASSTDLNKKLLELLMNSPQGSLHESVLQALNFEAKKLMQ